MPAVKEQAITIVQLLTRARLTCASVVAREAFTDEEALNLFTTDAPNMKVPDLSGIESPVEARDVVRTWLDDALAPVERYRHIRNSRACSPVGLAAQALEGEIAASILKATELIRLLDED